MTGVIYARYSSDNQREESIEGQLRECQAFAKQNDITLLEPYIDRALSAKKYRKLNMKQLDHRRRLIDSFVNAIYLFDDYLVITINYKEGTKTITFAEIEEAFDSDLSSLTAPEKNTSKEVFFQ